MTFDSGVIFWIVVAVVLWAIALVTWVFKIKDYKLGTGVLLILGAVVLGLAMLSGALHHSNDVDRNRVRQEIVDRYGPIKITSLSVRQGTITYEKDGRVCETTLIVRDGQHLIATIGAHCAKLP